MQNKGILVYRLVAVILLALSLWFVIFRSGDNYLRISVYSLNETSPSSEIMAEYPQFPDLSKKFNKKIYAVVEKEIAAFKESTQGRSGEGMPHHFSGSWSPEQLNRETVSILLRFSFYTGGAHGGQSLHTFTYDVENKKEIELSDLFSDTPDYLNRISQFAINDLKMQLQNMLGSEPNLNTITLGASPKKENFERFTINDYDVVTFYFPEYQVAPYAAGEQIVRMPLSFVKAK
jgi:hypothetical protein